LCQSGAGLDLDLDRQSLQHVVEQLDLVARIAARASHEQVGDASQNTKTVFHGAISDRANQFIDDRRTLRACIAKAGLSGVKHGPCKLSIWIARKA
jgi:hypothetical protein